MIVLCDGMIVLAYDKDDVMTMLFYSYNIVRHYTILIYAKTLLGFQLVMFIVFNIWYGECELATYREDAISAF